MNPAARVSAAIEVIADIETRRRPASDAIKDWGLSHRFAGSGDRAAIAGLVYDTLRRKASAAYLMRNDDPRALVLGMLKLERGLSLSEISELANGGRFAPDPLNDDEQEKLRSGTLTDAPDHVIGDYPEWLDPYFTRAFGDKRAEELAALARRAPLDLRVNTLKANRANVASELSHLKAVPSTWAPFGLRIRIPPGAKSPAIQAEPAFIKGHIEIQDEGSQLAAQLTGAKPGEFVIDLCAGGGGKTLALAAMMENSGRIIATDHDKRRLAPIHERLERAGVRNTEVVTPRGEADPLHGLGEGADLVLIDSPCTGTGVWRRNPDAKWRMRPGALEQRITEQVTVLDRAANLVKRGGRMAYVTCSVLTEENGSQIQAFLKRQPEFSVIGPEKVINAIGDRSAEFCEAVLMSAEGIQMSPRRTDTDGFFVSLLRRT